MSFPPRGRAALPRFPKGIRLKPDATYDATHDAKLDRVVYCRSAYTNSALPAAIATYCRPAMA